jgi:cell division protein FtsI/penicillin-binding protein 2
VVLNQVDMSEEMLKRVQQVFWLVTHGSKGTARGYFKDEPYNAAGKTGTSESYKNGVKTWNLSFAGYAPFNDPEIAIAVIVPNAYRDGYAQPHSAANIISQRVFRAYFDHNEKGQPTTK